MVLGINQVVRAYDTVGARLVGLTHWYFGLQTCCRGSYWCYSDSVLKWLEQFPPEN